MPRIIVTTDAVSAELTDDTPVLLDEHVHSVHLSTSHAAAQLVERLAWAVRDAESAEFALPVEEAQGPQNTQDTVRTQATKPAAPERPSVRLRGGRPQASRRSRARTRAVVRA